MISMEEMQPEHWQEVRAIYEDGIKTGNATFELSAPEWKAWDEAHLQYCRFIAVEGDKILGWSALSPVSGRCVYAGVAEVSVYVSTNARGKGLGKMLLEKLIEGSEANNLWTLQASIFPENVSSIKIHQHCGFRVIGKRERIGKINSIWRDTLLLERRSNKVGV
jgi:phosphinothricin acetyltransferase